MRTLISSLLIFVAAIFLLLGLTMPFNLKTQVAENRAYYQQFKLAAGYLEAHGRLPSEAALRQSGTYMDGQTIWTSLTTTPRDCDAPFAKARSDRFVLGFWRGEWFECYAYPSGRSTMPMSVLGYLRSGLGVDLAAYWLIAIGAAGSAVLIRRGRRARTP